MQKLMQLKNYLHELSFSALLIKVLYLGAGYGEALILISLVISMCYKHWIKQKIENHYEVLKSEMEANKLAFDKAFKDYTEETDRKFDNIFAKLNSQNLENSLLNKTSKLEKIAANVDKLQGVLNGQEEKRRLF